MSKMVEKNMKGVADYEAERVRGMAVFNCLNNASTLLSGRKYEKELLDAQMVFDLAEQLFDEAKKRDYWNYGKVNKTLAIPVAKVEMAFPELKVIITEKEGRTMDGLEDDILV